MKLLYLPFLFLTFLLSGKVAAQIPAEPLQIGHEPQFLHNLWVVDNHWAIKYKKEAVRRVFHPAQKHPANPVLRDGNPSYGWAVYDEEAGLFRLYYQKNLLFNPEAPQEKEGRKYRTEIACAESADGIHWKVPHLNLYPDKSPEPNNIVIEVPGHPTLEASAPVLLDVPEKDRHGFRYLMMYRAKGAGGGDANGIRLVGSRDGIHWDQASDTQIVHLHSDHHNSISYDPVKDDYVLYCRAKDVYRARGKEMIDTGASRRIATMRSKELWTNWMEHGRPQTILIPDETDNETNYNFFYGMPTRYFAGVFWGFLEPFRMNDYIHTELVFSRDGVNFLRLPGHPKLIEYGEDGAWDDTMIFASPGWVEKGDQWYLYYTGWDGPHGGTDRSGAFGLATVRKEGFVSLRGPRNGGVVCTRTMIWPGGDLVLNADAHEGELTVRVSNRLRQPVEGFNHGDGEAFTGDAVRHIYHWGGKSLNELKGQEIRLEFYLRDADLYTFLAGE